MRNKPMMRMAAWRLVSNSGRIRRMAKRCAGWWMSFRRYREKVIRP
jgi:hypothetical protein